MRFAPELPTKIEFARADIRDFAPKSEKGTVITNPPYGERMLSQKEVDEFNTVNGKVFPMKARLVVQHNKPVGDF